MTNEVKYILDKLKSAGHEAYIVGGCVRDTIMKRPLHDYDFCTSAKPDEVKAVFSDCKTIDTGLKHGTITLVLSNDNYEITTFRNDGKYSDGRHPDSVQFVSSLHEDLLRRDFTMNAIAFDGENYRDDFNGIEDIKNRKIRCVGNPDDRFQEDALRILRAMRFSSQLGFEIEEKTSIAMHKYKEKLKEISAERISSEFSKILLGPNVFSVLMEYKDIIAVFIPEVQRTFNFNQKNPWHIYNVYEHICHSVANVSQNIILKLTMFFHDIEKPSCFSIDEQGIGHFFTHASKGAETAEQILKRLKFPNVVITPVVTLIFNHDRDMCNSKKAVKKILSKLGKENTKLLLEVKRADNLAQNPIMVNKHNIFKSIDDFSKLIEEIEKDNECFQIKDLAVNGNDIMKLGIPPSPVYNEIFNFLMETVIDNKTLNEKNILLNLIKERYEL